MKFKTLRACSYAKLLAMLFLLLFSHSFIYGYWNSVEGKIYKTNANILVAEFDVLFDFSCDYADVTINEEFYSSHMTLNSLGHYEWKKDTYGNIINADEIRNITNANIIIKSDICYLVKNGNYNFIDHGIPHQSSPIGWALVPLGLMYVENWTYEKNHVVKTANGQHYSAKYYTTQNPLNAPEQCNKLEPVSATDFYPLLNLPFADYSNPKLYKLQRSYVWDSYTIYEVNDVVLYDGKEYVCIKSNSGSNPLNHNWAWALKIEIQE